ncbi:hypothetical protein [Clostridium sp. 'White wine YQ']|uniref:hypothetical protein n=1 Tax=Clostridium sp. 'White wine YQ' TaxID=3027474 RepID=UPI002365AC0F|nr:hypothetical protein [Clostridium sp. 'White wine YQ']MDD7794782.1 hypothetical protein [Clostridium sp. 'White wine YQ']
MLGFLINFFLFAPIPTLADENAWLGFYGSVLGAAIAGIVTIWGIEYTIKSTILNVKPAIRPVKTNFFLYDKAGVFITEKQMDLIIKEYAESKKVYFSEIDKLDYIGIVGNLVEEYKDHICGDAFSRVDIDDLFKEVKETCQLKSYQDALINITTKLSEKYENGIGEKLAEKIRENFRHKIAYEAMSEARNEHYIYYWIYNVGAGNAVDVRIEWDFSKAYHKKLCDDLGFNEVEYSDMLKKFSLDEIEIAEADVMLNTNDDNKVKVFVPTEVVLFIKHLYIKSIKNNDEKKYMNNNALVGEHQIAELNISCVDIHGKQHIEYYDVIFRIQSTLQNKYDFKEEHFYLKFNKKI